MKITSKSPVVQNVIVLFMLFAILTACGNGNSNEWTLTYTCTLGQGQIEPHVERIRCGTGSGEACSSQNAILIAGQNVPPNCNISSPGVKSPTKCPNCPGF